VLDGQQAELLTRYAQWFSDLHVVARNEWLRISAARKLNPT
jgi:ribosomal protein L11 methyltransferase